MSETALSFLGGAVTMGYALAALFFFRFWKRSRDRLFAAFAGAFLLLALSAATGIGNLSDDYAVWVYVIRFVAYSLIIIAIIEKNRDTGP